MTKPAKKLKKSKIPERQMLLQSSNYAVYREGDYSVLTDCIGSFELKVRCTWAKAKDSLSYRLSWFHEYKGCPIVTEALDELANSFGENVGET